MITQYPPGTARGDRPAEIVDPDGDTWTWTDGDKQGVPGYQFAGGGPCVVRRGGRRPSTATSPTPRVMPVGPAHTSGYVRWARYCVDRLAGCARSAHAEAHAGDPGVEIEP